MQRPLRRTGRLRRGGQNRESILAPPLPNERPHNAETVHRNEHQGNCEILLSPAIPRAHRDQFHFGNRILSGERSNNRASSMATQAAPSRTPDKMIQEEPNNDSVSPFAIMHTNYQKRKVILVGPNMRRGGSDDEQDSLQRSQEEQQSTSEDAELEHYHQHHLKRQRREMLEGKANSKALPISAKEVVTVAATASWHSYHPSLSHHQVDVLGRDGHAVSRVARHEELPVEQSVQPLPYPSLPYPPPAQLPFQPPSQLPSQYYQFSSSMHPPFHHDRDSQLFAHESVQYMSPSRQDSPTNTSPFPVSCRIIRLISGACDTP